MNNVIFDKTLDESFARNKVDNFKFVDIFSGIGGFHLALHSLGLECIFASEWDAHARTTYEHNFRKISPCLFEKNNFKGDIKDVSFSDIPDFDILCAGFPCQPFSQAGFKKDLMKPGELFSSILFR